MAAAPPPPRFRALELTLAPRRSRACDATRARCADAGTPASSRERAGLLRHARPCARARRSHAVRATLGRVAVQTRRDWPTHRAGQPGGRHGARERRAHLTRIPDSELRALVVAHVAGRPLAPAFEMEIAARPLLREDDNEIASPRVASCARRVARPVCSLASRRARRSRLSAQLALELLEALPLRRPQRTRPSARADSCSATAPAAQATLLKCRPTRRSKS